MIKKRYIFNGLVVTYCDQSVVMICIVLGSLYYYIYVNDIHSQINNRHDNGLEFHSRHDIRNENIYVLLDKEKGTAFRC